MNFLIFILIISIIWILMKFIWDPKIDYTRNGEIILWYGKKIRKYITIIKI